MDVTEGAEENVNHLSAKMFTEVIGALTGAASATAYEAINDLFWINIELALTAALKLGVIVDDKITAVDSIADLWQHQVGVKAALGNWDDRLNMNRLHNLEDRLSYKFRKPYLALESFTHPGHLHTTLPSYQRLEFLGDGLLDLFVNTWLLKEYPQCTEGQLTRIKGAAVSNQSLSALCVYKGL